MPGSNDVVIHGVTFKRDQIAGPYSVDMVAQDDGTVRRRYNVELVDGTEVSFFDQTSQNARVIMAKDGSISFDYIDGATVWDTPKDDHYNFCRCNNVNVKAKREKQVSGVFTSPSTFAPVSSYAYTKSKDRDTINAVLCQNMNVEYTPGYDSYNTNSDIFCRHSK